MGILLNPGKEAFAISVGSEIYVDKTGLLAFTNSRIGKEKRFICISRPRRFGKSMAANMLCAYYSRECDSAALFRDLKIAGDASFCRHLNRYDVIMLNIQQFLRKAENLKELPQIIEMKVLAELRERYPDLVAEDENSLPDALTVIYAKEQREDKGFVFILDEWDCIFREQKEDKDAQKAYLDFLRDLFKDRVYVKLAYMTGILPIKKYGTHSALNIFDEFSMTDPKWLAEYVGFTEQEARSLCESYAMDFDEVQRWYDGYRFCDAEHIYNPKSVVDAVTERRYRSYWISTETYDALRFYIDMNFDGLKDAVISMLGGIPQRIEVRTFQNDMTNLAGKDDVLTLLVHLGYLAFDEENSQVFIPNQEVAEEFRNVIRVSSGWEPFAEIINQSEALLEATLQKDADAVAAGIDEVHSAHTSVLSYNNENSLSCVITLAYFSAQKDYVLIREFPTGKGFADIVFLPRKGVNKPALIIELKWDASADGAISQIHQKKYVQALEGYEGEVLLVGINYDKKTKRHQCRIEMAV